MNNKIATISDLHLGCHCDSEHWHEITLNWGKWFRDELIDKDIDKIIICGDFFDNRNEIGVKTIAVASQLMDLWNDFEITMITGNHDLFYRNRNDVSSVSIFEGRKNVTLITKMTRDEIGERSVTYIPWGEDVSNCKKCDIIFGHLEINGFKMMPGKIAEGKTMPKSLTSKAKLTFSGHFHLRDERQYLKSKIIYIGSPYQINWGEASNMPGYYIVDVDDLSYEFFENTVSPKHIKMTSKKLRLDMVEGNIVQVEIDPNLDENGIEAIKTKVYDKVPLEVRWNILRTEHGTSEIKYDGNVNVSEVMMKFVDDLQLEKYSDEVKDKLLELYHKYVK